MIRFTMTALGTGVLVSGLAAQSDEEKYQKKLEKEFASYTTWVKTLDAAKEIAKKENKLIFGYFSRSYSP